MEIYSPFKVLHHQDKIELLKIGKHPIAAQIQIDITNICNHNCPFCTYRSSNTKTGTEFDTTHYITTERMLTLLEEIHKAGVKAIILQGGGEPFIHPGIIKILEKVNDLGLEYGIITNGTAIKDKHILYLKNASWIRFSVDAATNKTYHIVQATKNDIPKETIRKVKQACPNTVVGLSFLTKPENYSEAYSFAQMGKDLGVDNIRYSIVQSMDGKEVVKPYYKEYFELLSKAKELSDGNFRVFGLEDRTEALKNNKNYPKCYYQEFVGTIGANGNLYPCCWTKNITDFSLGNINEHSFKELWNGQRRMNHLKDHNLKKCPPCWFDNTNKLLNYVLKEDPAHVNFV